MQQKYGCGATIDWECQKCGHQAMLALAGVHESENGCICVYSDDDEYVCPNCGPESPLEGTTVHMY